VVAAVKDSLSDVETSLYPELVFTAGYELVSEASETGEPCFEPPF
jgi:hypothetical protein